jgi:hypothetical protein
VYNTLTLPGYSNTTLNQTAFAVGVAATLGLGPTQVIIYGMVNGAVGTAISGSGRRLQAATPVATPKVLVTFAVVANSTLAAANVSTALSNAVFNDALQTNLVSAGMPLLAGAAISLSSSNIISSTPPVVTTGAITPSCPLCPPPPSPPLPPRPPPSPPLPSPPPPSPPPGGLLATVKKDASKLNMQLGIGIGVGVGGLLLVILCLCVLGCRRRQRFINQAIAAKKAQLLEQQEAAEQMAVIPETGLDDPEAAQDNAPSMEVTADNPAVVALAETLATQKSRSKIASAEAAALEARAKAAEAKRRAEKAEATVRAAEQKARDAQLEADQQRAAAEDYAQRLSTQEADQESRGVGWGQRWVGKN